MSHFTLRWRDPSCPDTCPSAVCTKPCCARRRPADSDAPRCHLDGEEGARRREGNHQQKATGASPCPSASSAGVLSAVAIAPAALISNMLIMHASQKLRGIIFDVALRKQPPSWECDPAEKSLNDSPEKKSPPGYRTCRRGIIMVTQQTDRWRRWLKKRCNLACHLPLFESLCVSSCDVSSQLAVPVCTRLCRGTRLRQSENQSSRGTL